VISWILPQTEKTKLDNRKEDLFPAERWIRSRIAGEQLNEKLRDYLVSQLRDSAIEAVAPMRSPLWSRKESQRFGLASTWSERHAAYAAGLGTFGLSDGLITASGKAHRAGSVVARINVAHTPRPYNDHNAYCLFFNEGSCGACISRCPAGAISEQGHDKEICSNYVHVRCAEYASATFGMKGYGCGLCQTDVPCESRIPPKK
ncbi:MAG: epoxyqueuosine reductase, partial [Deltaproteobacteria bacterium]|nr:epoxyqueuosine reductase [Deltaproteobacteria bacterium]